MEPPSPPALSLPLANQLLLLSSLHWLAKPKQLIGQQDVLWNTSADERSVFEGKLMNV